MASTMESVVFVFALHGEGLNLLLEVRPSVGAVAGDGVDDGEDARHGSVGRVPSYAIDLF